MAQKIEIVRGTTNTFNITVTDANGDLYVLGNNEAVIFGVKKNPTDKELVIAKNAFIDGVGVYKVKLSPQDTENLSCGMYSYDFGLQSGTDYHNIVEPSPFVIQPEVTKWGVMGG